MAWNLPAPYGYTIFSDDVRDEIGGKMSYIGTYNATINFAAEAPVLLPKFVLSCFYYDSKSAVDPVRIVVFFPGEDQPVAEQTFEPPTPPDPRLVNDEGDELLTVIMTRVVLSPALLKGPGRIRVRAYRGERETRMGALQVVFQPQSTQSTPEESGTSKA